MTLDSNRNESDEMLMALADGELTGPDADRLRDRIAADPELAARYALFTRSAAALRQAMATGPVPDHLIAAVLTAPTGADSPDSDRITPLRPRSPSPARRLVWPLALAASLVLALGIGTYLGQSGSLPSGTTPAQAAAALTGTATGGFVTLEDGSTARALSSFDTDLGLCRLIALDSSTGQSDRALVCQHNSAEWQTALVVSAGDRDAFSLASDRAVEMVDHFLDSIGAGAPLTSEEEARALGQ